MKKILLTTLVVLSIFTLTGCGKENNNKSVKIDNEKIKTNTNEEVIKEVEIDGLKINRSSLVYEEGICTLTTSITNVSNDVIVVDSVKIIYSDKEGNETILLAPVGDPITQNQTVYVTSTTDIDLTNAVSVRYEIIK